MSQRIRYKKQDDGTFKSVRYFTSRQGDVSIIYNQETFEAKIVTASDGTLLAQTQSTDSNKMKIAIKKALNELGVIFVVESRAKRAYTDEAS